MREIEFRGKTIPQLLSCIKDENGNWIEKYTESEWVYGYYAPVYLCERDGKTQNRYAIVSDEFIGQPEMISSRINTGLPKMFEIIESTLGQYTGLKDKNGKKIFEGDIVRKITYGKMSDISKYENEKEFKKHKRHLSKHSKCIFDTEYKYHQNNDYKVEWVLNGFYPFADSPYNCGHCGCAENNEEMEVVGNIYDNPELLEVEK